MWHLISRANLNRKNMPSYKILVDRKISLEKYKRSVFNWYIISIYMKWMLDNLLTAEQKPEANRIVVLPKFGVYTMDRICKMKTKMTIIHITKKRQFKFQRQRIMKAALQHLSQDILKAGGDRWMIRVELPTKRACVNWRQCREQLMQ